ncbi:hypothetical protein M0657_001906 [Pyricularia oryzae]|uniref:Uncharacterized protein n=1 Tax=Pyricularia oryzae TaxID=318829 RepID=A0A4V1C7T0_PYROR|nr:hypothetical protein M9X92_001391 [Pyricularia oryzae]KAI7930101.1 hypothetical protein M0657_001906 [Pyricularia oryzae]QBZ64458.1 hypothetical protein PoMZ_06156 [Pyricularia oryzae]
MEQDKGAVGFKQRKLDLEPFIYFVHSFSAAWGSLALRMGKNDIFVSQTPALPPSSPWKEVSGQGVRDFVRS